MHELMDKCATTVLKLNPGQCKIKQKKIKFYGDISSADGIQQDPEIVLVLKKMTLPTSKQELQASLGLDPTRVLLSPA